LVADNLRHFSSLMEKVARLGEIWNILGRTLFSPRILSPMDSLQFSVTPYSFNALALLLIGLAGWLYLLGLREKTTAIYSIILVLGGFTLGMASWLTNGIVFWGGALTPFTEACVIVSMAGVIFFAYQYPRKANSLEARLLRSLAVLMGLAALFISLFFAFRFVVTRGAALWPLPPVFWSLNPVTSVVALVVCLRRTLVVQSELQPGGWRTSISAFWRPASHAVRLLRNFSFALGMGMVQGLVSSLDGLIVLPAMLAPLLLNLSMSLMFVVVVYSVFDLTAEQPRLVVRLVGLSLVTVLGMTGVVGMYTFFLASEGVNSQVHLDVALTQPGLAAGSSGDWPKGVVYILADMPNEADSNLATGRLLYAQPGVEPQALLNEPLSPKVPPVWSYYLDLRNICPGASLAQLRLRYGSQPLGSYYQYVGCPVRQAGVNYEIGFSLAEIDRATQAKSGWVWGLIWGSSLLVLIVFPRFFRTSLIRPLERLLGGVRQAESGDLEVSVPVTYQDEVGFLTSAFNKLTASLKAELAQRQRAEAELRQLNLTLEQRIADRTRELEALYEVSAAASQAQDSASLLNSLLERSLAALNCSAGFILLVDEATLQLAASRGLPPGWQENLGSASAEQALLAAALQESVPLLVPDLSLEARAPDFMRAGEPLTLLLAPLVAEGQGLGLLGLARSASRDFDLDEVALLVSIVSLVAAAVQTDRLRQVAQRATVLEERQRLARDLHDSVTQSLYGLATLTEAGKMRLEAGDLSASAHLLKRIGQTARQAIREMRLFLHQLRPSVLEQEGLVGALELRLAAVEGRSDVRATLEADENLSLPPEVENALYYIAQEALNNALKHAAASVVSVRLTRSGAGIGLEVSDNGCGFDPRQVEEGGMGLENMRARASALGAVLEIQSQTGVGTRVSVAVEGLP
jgi:signal transduction histidine kinase